MYEAVPAAKASPVALWSIKGMDRKHWMGKHADNEPVKLPPRWTGKPGTGEEPPTGGGDGTEQVATFDSGTFDQGTYDGGEA